MTALHHQSPEDKITIEPNELLFPVQKPHFPLSKMFTISNLSSEEILLNFKLQPGTLFTLHVDSSTPLPPQSQIDCCISYTPPSFAPREEIAIFHAFNHDFPIKLRAYVPQKLSFLPDTVDFGICQVGSSETREYTVTNTTDYPVSLTIDIRNVNPDVYFSNINETLAPSESCSLSIVYKPQFSLAHRFLGSASVAGIGQGHQFTAFYGGTEASDDAKLLFPIASGAKQENQKKKVLKGAPMLPVTQYSLPTSQSSTSPASSSTISHYLSQPNFGILVIKNLPPAVTMEQISAIFGLWGEIKEIRRMAPPHSQLFVEFVNRKDARSALANEFDRMVGGVRLHIEFARPGGRRKNEFEKYWSDRLRTDEDDGLITVLPQHPPHSQAGYTEIEPTAQSSFTTQPDLLVPNAESGPEQSTAPSGSGES
ncbi:hypothetical protein BLNAU_13481 [Blattamonas nauphoetae]|uniref:RRM domain-containing protein n=1 Tax=Blattamonas nauphoetae TaxID=2049346 RepID=A0ABQ9XLU1_9EUKA|nr:hypothetical protein BLNAU_13481 [Blattamonas nauphoetae]